MILVTTSKKNPRNIQEEILKLITANSLLTMKDLMLILKISEGSAKERISFDNFKSNLSHDLKNKGDIKFIIDTLKSNDIRNYFNKKWYTECFYLLASIDYLSRINNISLVKDYDDLRTLKLNETLYPSSILIYDDILKTNKMKKKAIKEAIPEFLRFNIIEGNIKDAV